MQIVQLGPGLLPDSAVITPADIATDDDAYNETRAAFEEHSMLVLRGQEVTGECQLTFSRRFGSSEVTKVGSLGIGSYFVILITIGPYGKVVPSITTTRFHNDFGNRGRWFGKHESSVTASGGIISGSQRNRIAIAISSMNGYANANDN